MPKVQCIFLKSDYWTSHCCRESGSEMFGASQQDEQYLKSLDLDITLGYCVSKVVVGHPLT